MFLAFPDEDKIGVFAGVSLLVLGSFVRSIPLQGGAVGVYHLAVVYILTLPQFSVKEELALAIGIVIHGVQTLFQILIGLLSVVYFRFSR